MSYNYPGTALIQEIIYITATALSKCMNLGNLLCNICGLINPIRLIITKVDWNEFMFTGP